MRRKRPPYPAEFRQQVIELVGAGRTPEEWSREFEPSARAENRALMAFGRWAKGEAEASRRLVADWLTSNRPPYLRLDGRGRGVPKGTIHESALSLRSRIPI